MSEDQSRARATALLGEILEKTGNIWIDDGLPGVHLHSDALASARTDYFGETRRAHAACDKRWDRLEHLLKGLLRQIHEADKNHKEQT